jgi:DNA topoisomerase-1
MGIDPDNGWNADWQIIPEKEKVIKSLRKAAKELIIYILQLILIEKESNSLASKERLAQKNMNIPE